MLEHFKAGNILHIENFQFGNGAPPKNKFLIIIAVDKNSISFAWCLTTSVDKVPDSVLSKVRHGCYHNLDNNLSLYIFEKGRSVCDNRFAFDKTTFIYYQGNVRTGMVSDFLATQHKTEFIGRLTDMEYERFVKCVKGSIHVKQSVKRMI